MKVVTEVNLSNNLKFENSLKVILLYRVLRYSWYKLRPLVGNFNINTVFINKKKYKCFVCEINRYVNRGH